MQVSMLGRGAWMVWLGLASEYLKVEGIQEFQGHVITYVKQTKEETYGKKERKKLFFGSMCVRTYLVSHSLMVREEHV